MVNRQPLSHPVGFWRLPLYNENINFPIEFSFYAFLTERLVYLASIQESCTKMLLSCLQILCLQLYYSMGDSYIRAGGLARAL